LYYLRINFRKDNTKVFYFYSKKYRNGKIRYRSGKIGYRSGKIGYREKLLTKMRIKKFKIKIISLQNKRDKRDKKDGRDKRR